MHSVILNQRRHHNIGVIWHDLGGLTTTQAEFQLLEAGNHNILRQVVVKRIAGIDVA